MTPYVSKRLLGLVGILILITVAGLSSWTAVQAAGEPKTLDRNLEPVVIKGTQLNALLGSPLQQLFVYTFTGSGLGGQIPLQIDEVNANGSYVSSEDNLLDLNDEVVFMAKDTGNRANDLNLLTALPISLTSWYELEIRDPVTPSKKGWAYLVRSTTLPNSSSGNYVDYTPGNLRISTTPNQYILEFAPDEHPGLETLSLFGGIDILDRTKLRVTQGLLEVTENFFGFIAPTEVKDGPVRTILQQSVSIFQANLNTTYKTYGSIVELSATVNSSIIPNNARSSIDFASGISPATFYNANTSGGVTINGLTDSVAETPLSRWFQVSHSSGRLIQVTDSSLVGGTQGNYYTDDNTVDNLGQLGSYGDSGYLFSGSINKAFTLRSSLYILPPAGGGSGNVGATYESFFFNPLSVCAALQAQVCQQTFLPIIFK